MRINAPRKNAGGMSLAPWLGIVLLALGTGVGWGAHVYLSRSDAEAVAECPKLPEPAPAPVCPSAADADPLDSERLPVYASEVTGEGVIEFKFYGPDGTQVTRKWITRIPLSAPEAAPEPEPDAPGNASEPEPAHEKSTTKTSEKSEVPSAKTAAKIEPKVAAATKSNETKPAKPATSKPTTGKGKFTVQTGAYKDRESAEAQVAKLERRGFDARIEKAVITGKGTWYRVRVGGGLSQADANAMATKIRKSAGLEASAVTQ